MPLPGGDELVGEAVAATGLDDFGPDGWREGLDVLLDALSAEAGLNALGEAALGERVRHLLRQRLAVVDWRRRHPGVADERIDGPVVICGLPRTGTTALSNLLAQDPATRSLRVWESARPVPPPEATTEADDPRITEVQAGLDLFHQMVPEMRALHDDTATTTAEGIDLLGMSFAAYHLGGMARVPTYEAWWLDLDLTEAYEFHRGVLQVLQSRRPPNRWHLKNPGDVFCLETVVAVYPDARFVWTHRDPVAVLPSVCDLVALVMGMGSERLDPIELGAHLLDLWATGIERGLAARARLGEDRFADVRVEDLVADPVATVAAAYDGVGWAPLSTGAEAAMAAWWAENPPGRHGTHRADPARYGLTPEVVDERFTDYRERFP